MPRLPESLLLGHRFRASWRWLQPTPRVPARLARGAGVALLFLSCLLGGCEKAPPPDPHLAEGLRLLHEDPRRALEQLSKARDSGRVRLARALAHEGLREYEQAERELERAAASRDDPGVWLPLARVQVMRGDLRQASANVERVLAVEPHELQAVLLGALLARDEAAHQAALGRIRGWPESRPTEARSRPVPAELHVARAALFRALGAHEEARRAIAAAQGAPLRSDRSALALASLALRAEQCQVSVWLLERLAQESRNPQVLRQAVVLTHALGMHELTGRMLGLLPTSVEDPALSRLRAEHAFSTDDPSAVSSLRRALAGAGDPRSVDAVRLRIMLAEALRRRGDPLRAKAELEGLEKVDPQNLAVQLALAQMALVAGDAHAAAARLKPLANESAPIPLLELLATAELEAGRAEEARAHLDTALHRDSTNPRALSILVAIELEGGDMETAFKAIRAGIEQTAKEGDERAQARLWLLFAHAKERLEGAAAREQTLRASVKAVPADPRLWLGLADALEAHKGPSEATAALREGLRTLPRSTQLLAQLARLLRKLGRGQEAVATYERLLEVASSDVVALNNAAMLYADELGDSERAVALAEKAHRLAPAKPEVTDTLGWTLFRRGKPEDLARARRLLEEAHPKLSDPSSKYHFGMVLLAAGEQDRGRRLLGEALSQRAPFPEADAARKALGGKT